MLRTARVALCLLPALLSMASLAHADEPPPLPPGPPAGQPPPPGYGQAPPGYGQPAPPAYYPAPGYGPQYYPQQGDPRPRTMDYDDGQEVPQGYHVRTKVRTGLIGGGSGLLGGLWIVSIITGIFGNAGHSLTDGRKDTWTPMYIPAVGPFVTMGTASSDLSGGGTALLAIDGIGQLGGLAMIIIGITVPKKQLVRDDMGGLPAFEIAPSVKVAPVVGLHNVGLVGTF
jgi:hypothetical protein